MPCAFTTFMKRKSSQPGYRASLYEGAVWPADMANLNRSCCVTGAGLPEGISSADVRVDTLQTPYPVFSYTREDNEVFIIGGCPAVIDKYVAAMDGMPAGTSPVQPHITKFNPLTGEVVQLNLERGADTIPYIGGALMHANGFVYCICQAHLYKINAQDMTIEQSVSLPLSSFDAYNTVYNGLTTSHTGEIIGKYFTYNEQGDNLDARVLMFNPDDIEDYRVFEFEERFHPATARLTVGRSAGGQDYLYHLNRINTFRYHISGMTLAPDKDWIAHYDPYNTGEARNAEPTSPVMSDDFVCYTTNTYHAAQTAMKIFWQDADTIYHESDTLTDSEYISDRNKTHGWSWFHVSIDEINRIVICHDQGNGFISAMRFDEDGITARLWEKDIAMSARPAIASSGSKTFIYATDYVDGNNHLVRLNILTGEEDLRVRTPATRPTISTIVIGRNEVYFGSNETGKSTGLYHRFYIQ